MKRSKTTIAHYPIFKKSDVVNDPNDILTQTLDHIVLEPIESKVWVKTQQLAKFGK